MFVTGIINQIINKVIFAAMFKQLTALFLFFSFVAQTFSSGFVMLQYITNNSAFARNCVNKSRPQMHCNGKCQMMKKLREAEKKDQQMPEKKFEKRMDVLSSKSFYCSVTVPLTILNKAASYEIARPIHDISIHFFHPPKASLKQYSNS